MSQEALIDRYGTDLGIICYTEARKKALDAAGAAAFNDKLAGLWPELRHELQAFAMPVADMEAA